MPCHAVLCRAVPWHAGVRVLQLALVPPMSCAVTPCHAMPCHAVPCHAVNHSLLLHLGPGLCHAMPAIDVQSAAVWRPCDSRGALSCTACVTSMHAVRPLTQRWLAWAWPLHWRRRQFWRHSPSTTTFTVSLVSMRCMDTLSSECTAALVASPRKNYLCRQAACPCTAAVPARLVHEGRCPDPLAPAVIFRICLHLKVGPPLSSGHLSPACRLERGSHELLACRSHVMAGFLSTPQGVSMPCQHGGRLASAMQALHAAAALLKRAATM